jgi:uncharacterized protein YndB with AHSA1/START domain
MSDTAPKTVQVTATHRYEVAPERVFDAWLDPAIAGQFLFATPTGRMIRAEIDPRIGGRFTFTDRRPDMGDIEHVGTYVEIDRPRRLVFDFAVPKFSLQVSTVTLDFAPSGDGCELTLTHDGVLEEYAKGTRTGWSMILAALGWALTS